MKVILLKDIAHIGQKDDLKEVRDGYARNFLLPQGLAEIATTEALERIQRLKAQTEAKEKEKQGATKRIFDAVRGKTFIAQEKVGEEGQLFAGISAQRVVEILSESKISGVDEKNVVLEKHIKKIGMHDVVLRSGDLETKFKLEVKQQDS